MGDSKGLDGAPLNLCQRISRIMKDVSYVCKEDKKVNNQYKFVSHDAVTAKIRVALVKHGVISIPTVVESSRDNNRTLVKVRVDFINIDLPEDKISVDYIGEGIDQQDKGVGKAISYAVKYAYLKVFALETGDDPERDNIDYQQSVKPVLEAVKEIEDAKTEEKAKELATYFWKKYNKKHDRELILQSFDKKKLTFKNKEDDDTDEVFLDVPQ